MCQTLSLTSIYIAASRAIGAREPDPSVRNPDYLAEKLLDEASRNALHHPIIQALDLSYDEAMKRLDVALPVRMSIVRTRLVEEALERAIATGTRQVVILGAGLDTHAYRCTQLLTSTSVFEVDKLGTQQFKRRRLLEVLGQLPSNVFFVDADFSRGDLRDRLLTHGYDPSAKTFFIMEGVSYYLTETALRSILAFVRKHPPGSRILLDFLSRSVVDRVNQLRQASLTAAQAPSVERFLRMTRSEPWLFGLPSRAERRFLKSCRLHLLNIVQVERKKSVRRYLTRADGTEVGGEAVSSVSLARGSASWSSWIRKAIRRPRTSEYRFVEAGVRS